MKPRTRRRMRGGFKALERNEDEAKKLITSDIAELGRYPYDILEG